MFPKPRESKIIGGFCLLKCLPLEDTRGGSVLLMKFRVFGKSQAAWTKLKARANGLDICFNIRSILLPNSDVETVCDLPPFNRVKMKLNHIIYIICHIFIYYFHVTNLPNRILSSLYFTCGKSDTCNQLPAFFTCEKYTQWALSRITH